MGFLNNYFSPPVCCKEASFQLNSLEMSLMKCTRSQGIHGEHEGRPLGNLNVLHPGRSAETQCISSALCYQPSPPRWRLTLLGSQGSHLRVSPASAFPVAHPQSPSKPCWGYLQIP